MYDVSNIKIKLEDSYILRFRIYRDGHDPIIDITEGVATSNGSYITHRNPMLVYITQDDADFAAGVYNVRITVTRNKTVLNDFHGCLWLYGTILGGDLAV